MAEDRIAASRSAVERAVSALDQGGETAWEETGAGRGRAAGRRALRRALRPLEFRQRERDGAILDAVAEVARATAEEGAGALALAAPLDPAVVEEVGTRIGPLWLRRDDTLVAPTIREHGIYGTEIAAFLRRRLRVGSTFVDVGANIGWFSVLACSLVGERGRVIAVEPDPANLPLLRANLWRQGAANATVLPVAAWSQPAMLELVTYPEGGAASEVSGGSGEASESAAAGARLVPAAPLDELIAGAVDVAKIDAQMTDHLAVRGAERIIARSPAIALVIEFFPAALRDKGEDPERVLGYYLDLGLELGMLDREGRGEVEPKTAAEVFAACENPEIPFVDVVLTRGG